MNWSSNSVAPETKRAWAKPTNLVDRISKMNTGGNIVVNPAFQGPEYMLSSISEENDLQLTTVSFSQRKLQGIQEKDSTSLNGECGSIAHGQRETHGSSNRVVMLLMGTMFLISVGALSLTMLILFGKIGSLNCSCSQTDGKFNFTSFSSFCWHNSIADHNRSFIFHLGKRV